MNSDGSNQRNLTNHPAYESESTFSPDGSKIAFTTDRDGKTQIYVMKPDGSEQKTVARFSGQQMKILPGSPDGKWIAFKSDRDGKRSQLYVMRADGSDPRRLTTWLRAGGAMAPSWSVPDGSAISFTEWATGKAASKSTE